MEIYLINMEANIKKKIQWIPSDYIFGTAFPQVESQSKQQISQNCKDKSFSFQKTTKKVPSIESTNKTQIDTNLCKVNLAEFLKKSDRTSCTVFNCSKKSSISHSGGKFLMKRIITN